MIMNWSLTLVFRPRRTLFRSLETFLDEQLVTEHLLLNISLEILEF